MIATRINELHTACADVPATGTMQQNATSVENHREELNRHDEQIGCHHNIPCTYKNTKYKRYFTHTHAHAQYTNCLRVIKPLLMALYATHKF